MKELRSYLRRIVETGFVHIVGAGSINKILTFAMSMVLVRILSKEDYGCYAYAYNIASFFILFNGLGMTSAILQICSELHDEKSQADAMYGYCRKCSVLCDIAICAGMAIVAIVAPLAIDGSNRILLLYCLLPITSLLCEIKLTRFRVNLENQVYALMTNVQTVLYVGFSLIGAAVFGVEGLVIGQSLAYALAWIVMCVVSREKLENANQSLTQKQKRDAWGISLVSSLNNALGHALTLVGTFLVGVYLTDANAVADFKVATAVPFGLLFIPGMVVTYAYPFFARNKDNRIWTIKNYARLICASAITMGTISVMLAVFATPVLTFVFGAQYSSATSAFRILLLGFFITAAFRQPTGNLLVTQRKLAYNTLVGVASIVLSVLASMVLIPSYGMIGAAMAYSVTMLLGALMNVSYYLHTIRKIPS